MLLGKLKPILNIFCHRTLPLMLTNMEGHFDNTDMFDCHTEQFKFNCETENAIKNLQYIGCHQ